ASAGLAGWVEFFLLRRELDKRIGQTRLVPSQITKLWLAAIIGASLPWLYKLFVDRGSPLISAHENAVHSKLMALVLLAVYGLTYLAMTVVFRIPEASNVVNRARRVLKLRRGRA
ncbi:MAG TPA: hypothetical protein VFP26_16250, partial [Gemmatimonadaceae bacterium]|nr:hypothetical protein [Gemmatimonadaceae bacterium]